MSANVISVIQPGGSSGTTYNVRASGLRCFLKNDNATAATPAEGCTSWTSTTKTINITCAQIDGLFSGLTFAFVMPYTGDTEAGIKINALDRVGIVLHNGLQTNYLVADTTYLAVYNGTNFVVMDSFKATHNSSDITNGSYTIPDANAVYNYVSNLVANRFEYVVCAASESSIPNGATYYDGTSTITGTMAASSSTEYKIYLVRHNHTVSGGTNESYDEWITLKIGSNYSWEKIGNTDIDTAGIANAIAGSIIGSIADHTIETVDSASVNIGSHTHGFTGGQMTSTGNYTPEGTVNVGNGIAGTSYTPGGTISVGGTTGVNYTPAGSVISTFTGDAKYINVAGSQGTVSVSTTNVTTGNNSSANCSVTWGTGTNYTKTTPTATISGKSNATLSTNTSSDGSHTHTISGNGSSSAINGSSFTVSTKDAMAVTITNTTASANDKTFQVPISSATVTAQAEYSSATSGDHTHLGTINQQTLSGTLSNPGSASSYTVSGEVLTLTPSTTPGNSVTVKLGTTAVNIGTAGRHSHNIDRTADATISVTGGNVKLTASTPSHNHTLSGSVTPTITMGGTISTAGGHSHNTTFTSTAVAGVLNATVSQIGLLVGVGTHTHTITSLSASGSFTPSVTVNTNTTGGTGYVNITPSGSVSSSFVGTATKLAFSGSQVKFAFNGTSKQVSVVGTTVGTIGTTAIGNKTVSLTKTDKTLTHTLSN